MTKHNTNFSDWDVMKQHIVKIRNESICDRYGLISYTYNDGTIEDGYYNPGCVNIGDYIQSLAARQFLPRVDSYVDRDQLGVYRGHPINMIMNAWYFIWKKNEVFSKKIRPLFVSIHLNNTESLSEETLKYFKENEPIGCRDYATRDFLTEKGIVAYFSGCLTLTLGETYTVGAEEKTEDVYFVDYKMGAEYNKEIDALLSEVLKSYDQRKIYYRTHKYPLGLNYVEGLKEAESLLKAYSRAKLVITENIHCALPCLAMGVPVILIVPTFDHKRFDGIFPFFNYIGEDDSGCFSYNLKYDQKGFIQNDTKHEPYASNLKEICFAFTKIKEIVFRGMQEGYRVDIEKNKLSYKVEKQFKFFQRQKNGMRRKIIVLGFIKINYTKTPNRFFKMFTKIQDGNRTRIVLAGIITISFRRRSDFERFFIKRLKTQEQNDFPRIPLYSNPFGGNLYNYSCRKDRRINRFLKKYLYSRKIETTYSLLDNITSKGLFLDVLFFKLLGPVKVRLPLFHKENWGNVAELYSRAFLSEYKEGLQKYNLTPFGYNNINLITSRNWVYENLFLKQYLYRENDIMIQPKKGDFVIDGGACFGDNALCFADLVGETGKVFSFELCPENIEIFKENMRMNEALGKRMGVVQKALSDETGKVLSVQLNGGASTVCGDLSKSTLKVDTLAIDDAVASGEIPRVDFIKLDIEGAELAALRGAATTIKRFKPNLAISVYHRTSDYFEIPLYLKSLLPEYRFYFNHYTAIGWESILYATTVDGREVE